MLPLWQHVEFKVAIQVQPRRLRSADTRMFLVSHMRTVICDNPSVQLDLESGESYDGPQTAGFVIQPFWKTFLFAQWDQKLSLNSPYSYLLDYVIT